MTSPLDPEQRLVVYTVEPDSPTAHVLPLLAGWTTVVDRWRGDGERACPER